MNKFIISLIFVTICNSAISQLYLNPFQVKYLVPDEELKNKVVVISIKTNRLIDEIEEEFETSISKYYFNENGVIDSVESGNRIYAYKYSNDTITVLEYYDNELESKEKIVKVESKDSFVEYESEFFLPRYGTIIKDARVYYHFNQDGLILYTKTTPLIHIIGSPEVGTEYNTVYIYRNKSGIMILKKVIYDAPTYSSREEFTMINNYKYTSYKTDEFLGDVEKFTSEYKIEIKKKDNN